MNSEGFSIRPVRETDLDEWFRLRKLLWEQNERDDHHTEMLGIIANPDTQLVLVAELLNGRLGAFLEASIRPFVEDCETNNVGYLEGWYVEPELRKRGIGRCLVLAAEAWARQKGCTEMASDAEIGNVQSLAAHSRLGYSITSRLVHLRKELDG